MLIELTGLCGGGPFLWCVLFLGVPYVHPSLCIAVHSLLVGVKRFNPSVLQSGQVVASFRWPIELDLRCGNFKRRCVTVYRLLKVFC